jgi:hypothetical protein
MVHFVIDSSFWKNCKPLSAAVERASQYSALPEFVNVVKELIKRCLLENSGGIDTASGNEEELLNAARTIIERVNVRVFVGDCYEGDFANHQAAQHHIYLNPGWIGQIQRLHEKGTDEQDKLNMQLALLVVKLLHEYALALTPAILEAEFAIRIRETIKNPNIPTTCHEKTPKKIGFKLSSKGEKNKGDMGFACEELLTNGFRFCQGKLDEGDYYAWNYANFELYSYNEDTKMFNKVQALNYDDLVQRISSSTEMQLTDFKVEIISSKKHKVASQDIEQSRAKRFHELEFSSHSEDELVESEEEEDEDRYDETGFSLKYGPLESGRGNRDRKV